MFIGGKTNEMVFIAEERTMVASSSLHARTHTITKATDNCSHWEKQDNTIQSIETQAPRSVSHVRCSAFSSTSAPAFVAPTEKRKAINRALRASSRESEKAIAKPRKVALLIRAANSHFTHATVTRLSTISPEKIEKLRRFFDVSPTVIDFHIIRT